MELGQSVTLEISHYLIREGIAALIGETPGFELLEQRDSEPGSNDLNKANQLAIVYIDEQNPISPAKIDTLSIQFRNRLLAIVETPSPNVVKSLLKLNVKGILTKDCSKTEIVSALQAVALNQRFYCNNVLGMLVGNKLNAEEPSEPSDLTPRELEILERVVEGQTTHEIAEELHISFHTVNSHRKNITKKLDISSPVQLVAYAIKHGLVKIGEV